MPIANVIMLAAGLALAAWTSYQHLGRTRGSREWSKGGPGTMTERSTLVVHPLLAVICVLAGIGNDTVEPAGVGALLWGAVATCLLVLGVFILLPIPVPDIVKPRWYREHCKSRASRG